jgi:hypothetical protein
MTDDERIVAMERRMLALAGRGMMTIEEFAERIVALERRMLAVELHLSVMRGTVSAWGGESEPMQMGPDEANKPREEA